ncbi:MAG: cytochrome c3 family protein [Gemmatimonadaceae bacterium]|nr:cytochrome c3 family protein [Gemmatimonadaceae bacterium]
MRSSKGPVLARLAAVVIGAVAASSCTSEKIVYRSEPSFTAPPAAAANFVGYSDTLTKQTVCGNCHVDQQTKWETTKHANAWADLQASGHAGASCVPCHTVSANGNAVTDTLVGYVATKDARYEDVQCENCHGPGLAHVSAPALSNRPLASIAVDTGTAFGNGCGECHTGVHEPFVDEWRQSRHAVSVETPTKGNATCQPCHTAQGALAAWNVNTNYVEASQLASNPQPIVCATCHDPHGSSNPAQLRWPINVADVTQNLCMKCHQRNATADPTNTRGPHSPEGETLLGTAGWWPPGTDLTDTIVATHGSSANPELCVTCHVSSFAVNNPATGSLVFQATGHLFVAIPCLDANGLPTTASCDVSQRTFGACTASGCHGSESVARSAMTAASSRLALLDSALNSQLVKIPASEFAASSVLTTAKGAKFNLQLAEEPGAVVHNPFLMEALLTASIKQVQLTYGIPPTISVNLANILPATAKSDQ